MDSQVSHSHWLSSTSVSPNVPFTEDLGNGVGLEMLYIPGGRFWMGLPESEEKRFRDESPQHKVTVPAFYMGKYPVTQQQWLAVSFLNDINRELKPMPSGFKGDNHPVEQVSWEDAVEFCKRLSKCTGRRYRLPSEAEWEHACRAGTTTPFHFGETLTAELANYRATSTYGSGPKGKDRRQTTDVGSFPANAFGLHDMHGNVWEWCLDHWHENYEGAPIDGSAWVSDGESKKRVVRGGSWYNDPRGCRSAYRYYPYLVKRNHHTGFRVVCAAPRTL